MAKKLTRMEKLAREAAERGLVVRTWSPGDGVTRYRFFEAPHAPGQSYYGPANGIFTALGLKEAYAFLHGAGVGGVSRRNPRGSRSRKLSVPEQHQFKIAEQTLRMPDAMIGVMGGPTKKQAHSIVRRLRSKHSKHSARRNPSSSWSYEGYWNVVLGHTRSPHNVVSEFGLVNDRRSLDEWLGHAEEEAIHYGRLNRVETLKDWEGHHARALDELMLATEGSPHSHYLQHRYPRRRRNNPSGYAIWTVKNQGDGPVRIGRVGDEATKIKALRAAKRLAGRGARFVRRGIDVGYVGEAGTAWIEAVPHR